MIDSEGFRPNVGIILANESGQVLWAKRIGHNAWQFPQGGIQYGETPEQALFRELRYRLPNRYIRPDSDPVCIGQKQKWFLLKLTASAQHIQLDLSDPPEFDQWQWVSYWYPLGQVVNFKRDVYRKAMMELCNQLPQKP